MCMLGHLLHMYVILIAEKLRIYITHKDRLDSVDVHVDFIICNYLVSPVTLILYSLYDGRGLTAIGVQS